MVGCVQAELKAVGTEKRSKDASVICKDKMIDISEDAYDSQKRGYEESNENQDIVYQELEEDDYYYEDDY